MDKRLRITVNGRVQGVGFRPTVYRFALVWSLTGTVSNHAQGVVIEVQGHPDRLTAFSLELQAHPPANARVESLRTEEIPLQSEQDFRIISSQRAGELLAGMPPDLGLCPDCLQELFSPENRRFHYPFINCTNCGPRFTIIGQLPYDRPYTSMAGFKLCPACSREYTNPEDRRFDAQPNACPVCGPSLGFLDAALNPLAGDSFAHAVRCLKAGAIVAIKSLGGYHLACDARQDASVRRLRQRKNRPDKSLAVMFASLSELRGYCATTEIEEHELSSPAQPIVILKIRQPGDLSPALSPDSPDIGAFLPYTPLHHLLLAEISPLVMTSANRCEEPIITDEPNLADILGSIADYALTHNRPIVRRCDDSVLKIAAGRRLFFRRSRGFVPDPITLPFSGQAVLGCGAENKNTFCLTHHHQAVLSQHIGDLSDYPAFRFYEEEIQDLKKLLDIEPTVIAHDCHPDYRSTRYALASGIAHQIPVQHHHAHIAACMAENQLKGPVLGVAFDGSGYGLDGTVWGGEFLKADYIGFTRKARLFPVPMPGNEEAVLHPQRMAFSCLYSLFPDSWKEATAQFLPGLKQDEIKLLAQMIKNKFQAPLTSSVGRLFDSVAALLAAGGAISYEGQAAVRLQALVDPRVEDAYPFSLANKEDLWEISLRELFAAIMTDLEAKIPVSRIAGRFHNTLAEMIMHTCSQLRGQEGLNQVALSGGVFQNDFLLEKAIKKLKGAGFDVYHHQKVPPNDAGVSLGQAAVAMALMARNQSNAL
jgi:hydrogenase maturation protein HypF